MGFVWFGNGRLARILLSQNNTNQQWQLNSSDRHTTCYACVICDFEYLIGFDVHILRTQEQCSEHNQTLSQYVDIYNLECISYLIFILLVGRNSSKTEKFRCRRQNPYRAVLSEEDDEEEKDIHSISVYLWDILLNLKHHSSCMRMYHLM